MLVSWAHKHAGPVSVYACTFLYCNVFTAFIVCVNMQVYEYMAAVRVCACAQCVLVWGNASGPDSALLESSSIRAGGD